MLALMPAHALDVDREAIRVLVQDVGYQPASEKTGIPYATLRQWAKRYGWNGIRHAQAVTSVTRPGDAHLEILEERKRQSAVNLSKYIVDASKKLAESNGELEHARPGKDIVAMRSGIYPEANATALFSLNVLNLGDGNVTIGASRDDPIERQADARDV